MQHFFATLFQKHRDKTVLGALVTVSVLLLVLPEPRQADVARRMVATLTWPLARAIEFAGDYTRVRDENARLKRMVASLMLERQRLLQFREERERLRRLAAFKEEQFYRFTPAEVVGRSLDRYRTVLTIDKGARDSLRVRMPVFSYEGLAGRLVRVFPRTAWVELLCSRNQPVSVMDRRSRVVGILEWETRDRFTVSSVSAVEDVIAGDTLITSGFGGVVPKGFPVAVVGRVSRASDGLALRIEARALVNFDALEEVFVMTDEIPWDRSVFYDHADTLLMKDILRRGR